ncbi:unnamed protein product [Soboliphyme baturini]|uniref:40S ribosomal protein S30 n=1 Tax=Soboliphyme baturini TaxID=241478 RepID=A0A183IBZ5_9BILA|nr:unnamed protein product [Soboliphyme baturini]
MFAAEGDVTGMRVNVLQTKSLLLSRSPARCSIQVNGETKEQVEKFKYLEVVFTSDGEFEEEIARRTGVASDVLRQLARSTVTKTEVSLKTKLSVFKSIFIPMFTYGHEWWMKLRTLVQVAEMGFLRRVAGLTRLDMRQGKPPTQTAPKAGVHVRPKRAQQQRKTIFKDLFDVDRMHSE